MAVWQPLQTDHKDAKGREDGSYSDMQKHGALTLCVPLGFVLRV